jgi:MFS family permease
MPLYINGQVASAEQVGLLMAVIILVGMVVQPVVSYLSPRMSKSLLMAMFCLLATIGIAGILSAVLTVVLIGSYFLLGACCFALYPIAITLACDLLPNEKIVSATEVMLLSYSAGSVIGPILVLAFHEYEHGLILYLGLCLIATCLYLLFKSTEKAPIDHYPLPD